MTRMQNTLTDYQKQRAQWQDLTARFSRLRESSRHLFGFDNPFNERTASSSSDSTFTASATRQASTGTYSVLVRQTATADSFLSRALPQDYRVPAGTYVFRTGDQEIRLNYRGGTVRDFAESLNARGEGALRATVLNDTAATQVISIESLKTGGSNSLTFGEAALAFALDSGNSRTIDRRGDQCRVR